MKSFKSSQTISDFQQFIYGVYGLPDDRLYSIWDLLTQQQRFTMRALKGIRKQSTLKVTQNLLIAFSWSMAIANRLHLEVEEGIWKRFPGVCSYCAKAPCACPKLKLATRPKITPDPTRKPHNLAETQAMFEKIYPANTRTLADAGVHLAEEMGEVSEAIHNFLGHHTKKYFTEIGLELVDYISCIFGVANSAKIDLAKELEKIYYDNCHVCHKLPCECNFTTIAQIVT